MMNTRVLSVVIMITSAGGICGMEKSSTYAIVFGNPHMMVAVPNTYMDAPHLSKYKPVSNLQIRANEKKVFLILSTNKKELSFDMYRGFGFFKYKFSKDMLKNGVVEQLLKVEGVVRVGKFENLNLVALGKLRRKGDKKLEGIFNKNNDDNG